MNWSKITVSITLLKQYSMRHKFILIYSWFVRVILILVPDFPLTMRIRGALYGLVMKKCGSNFQVANNVILKGIHNFSIGNNVFFGNNCIIMGSGNLRIEDEVMIAPNTVIVTGNHTSVDGSFRFGAIKIGEIMIQKGSWVGANCSIAIGAILPAGCVLGANSFLNKPFYEENSLYAGAPARYIKKIDA